MQARSRRSRGFTALEVTIVVAIVGLLAAVAIPQFTCNREDGRAQLMLARLAVLRTAIDSYASEHGSFPGPDAMTAANQLLRRTNKEGKVGATDDFSFGPYLSDGALPTNPYTNSSSLLIVDRMPALPSGEKAWMYCPKTGQIRGNATGTSSEACPPFNQ